MNLLRLKILSMEDKKSILRKRIQLETLDVIAKETIVYIESR